MPDFLSKLYLNLAASDLTARLLLNSNNTLHSALSWNLKGTGQTLSCAVQLSCCNFMLLRQHTSSNAKLVTCLLQPGASIIMLSAGMAAFAGSSL